MEENFDVSNPTRPYGDDMGRESGPTIESLQAQLQIMGLTMSQQIRSLQAELQQVKSLPGMASDIELVGGFAERVGDKLMIELPSPEREELIVDEGIGAEPVSQFLPQLTIVDTRPPGADEKPDPEDFGVWITWGVVAAADGSSGLFPSNITDFFPVTVGVNDFFWLRVGFDSNSEDMALESVSIERGSSFPAQPSTSASAPTHAFYNLGSYPASGVPNNTGYGSVTYWLQETYGSLVTPSPGNPGGFNYQRRPIFIRTQPVP